MRALLAGVVAALAVLAAGCGGDPTPEDAEEPADDDAATEAEERPTVAVMFNILADVAQNTYSDEVELIDVMPRGVDPHSYEISAAEAEPIYEADLMIANGLDHEEGLASVIRAAEDEGVPLLEVAPEVDPLPYDPDVVEDEPAEGGTLDPHFFTDPARMAEVPHLMVDALVEVAPEVDEDALRASADAYTAELEALHEEADELLADVPDDRRYLVTNHSVFNYFGERYDFTEVGAVVPSGTTLASPSAADLEDLATTIDELGVPAIFVDVGSPDALARALAEEVDVEVEIVPLHTETLGEDGSGAETYVDKIRTNASEIARALGDG